MKLYHVTDNLLHDGKFYPKIPTSRLEHEDATIKRVCFGKTIEGCLSSMPNGGANLGKSLEMTNGVLKVFEIDTNDISPEFFMTPKELVKESLVPDAKANGEYWVTRPVNASRSYLIQIHDYHFWDKKVTERWKGGKVYFSVSAISKLVFSSSLDKVATVKLPYPGDEEMETFLNLMMDITGDSIDENVYGIYRFAKNQEEALYVAANYGGLNEVKFQTSIGGYIEDSMDTGAEEFKTWNGRVIFRDIFA